MEEMFVVYSNPLDYPNKFVVRRWAIGPGYVNADGDWFYLGETLEEVRSHVPKWCIRIDRQQNDEPQIVEVWI
jgi:hypothetical protein